MNRIALYLRISREEDARLQRQHQRQESGSIDGQRKLLHQYLREHGWEQCDVCEYVDDGFSGVNTKRPALQRLLAQAAEGKTDLILVKDLSRLSRDYLWLGECLLYWLPQCGVRLVAVADGFDSWKEGEGLQEAFLALLYDFYSQELSHKVRQALTQQRMHGDYVAACTPYGYQRSEQERQRLEINEEQAAVVRTIFEQRLKGWSVRVIAEQLNAHQVLAPRGGRWYSGTVSHILKNRTYLGELVFHKCEREEVAGNTRWLPPAKWKTITEHHLPLIEQSVFNVVQQMGRSYKSNPALKNKKSRVCRCGICGCFMRESRKRFSCPTCRLHIEREAQEEIWCRCSSLLMLIEDSDCAAVSWFKSRSVQQERARKSQEKASLRQSRKLDVAQKLAETKQLAGVFTREEYERIILEIERRRQNIWRIEGGQAVHRAGCSDLENMRQYCEAERKSLGIDFFCRALVVECRIKEENRQVICLHIRPVY